jgi:hypothetical protein
MRRYLALAAALVAAGIIACGGSPGLDAATAAEPTCRAFDAPGDAVDGSAGSAALEGDAGAGGFDAAASSATPTPVGPGPVCATGGQ